METPTFEVPTKKLLHPGFWRDVGAASAAKEICCKSCGRGIRPVVYTEVNQRKH
jgi:hypothetical protein